MAVGFEPTGTATSHPVTDWLGYAWGQCTAFVAESVSWLNGGAGLGNAKDWLTNASRQGYTIVTQPVVGAVAVFGGGLPGSGGMGHVGIVSSISGSNFALDQANVAGLDVVNQGTYSTANPNLLGFILPKGDTTGASPGLSAQLTAQFDWLNPTTWIPGMPAPPDQNPAYGGNPNASNDPFSGLLAGLGDLLGGIVLRILIGLLAVVFVIEGLRLIGSSSGHDINISLPSGKATGGATEGIAADAAAA